MADASTSALTALANAVAAVFGWAREKLGLKNTAKMQANAEKATDAAIKADASKTVASGDLEKIRKAAAE